MTGSSSAGDVGLAVFRFTRYLHAPQVSVPSHPAVRFSAAQPGVRLTLRESSALSTLVRSGPMSPGSLAAQEGVRHASLTPVIASLDALGLLHQAPNPADRRSTVLAATDAGADYVRDEGRAPGDWLDHRLAEP